MRGKMRTTTFFILLVVCTSNFGFAGETILPRLPDLYAFRYTPAPRDPFISSDAGKTLVGKGVELDNSFSSKAAQRYLQTLVTAIQNDLFVEGVSTGEGQSRAIALINGVAFSETEKIPVTVSETDLIQLTELARTYGLPLERDTSEKSTILLEVGPIDSGGVSILLPGFKAPLCKLPYVGDSGTERITLERKKKAEHD
jgi:hypothetical protein